MKTYANDQLRNVLNYDSNERACLSFDERCEIHKAISHKLTYETAYEFTGETSVKIFNIIDEIARKNYEARYYLYHEEKTTGRIQLKR
jgi:hypothetical protein